MRSPRDLPKAPKSAAWDSHWQKPNNKPNKHLRTWQACCLLDYLASE